MPTPDPLTAITVADARRRIAAQVFDDSLVEAAPARGAAPGKIGLEPEFLVLGRDADGAPTRRIPLEGPASVLAALQPLVGRDVTLAVAGPPPVYELENGGRLTFEPGGQVEHSTAIHDSAAAAMDDVDRTEDLLSRAMESVEGVLAPVGLDVWTDRSRVEQQLRAPRYDAMAAYFDRRSPQGRVMMRHTGSFQVNLDLGAREVASARWRLANLLSPLSTASFACSPEDGALCRRALAWQGLDPTRTGFPLRFLEDPAADPGQAYAEFALDADVLLFRTGEHGADAGEPGFTMRDWIERGHPRHPGPGEADLDYHLTTLFPEVRLRGFLEIRSCDALPRRWRGVNVVFWAGLLYDRTAREAALARMQPILEDLPRAWVDAATHGLQSPLVREDAVAIWTLALEGARRLPTGWFREADLATTEAFVERFVKPLRSPAVELAEALRVGPSAALEWARGPR